MLFIQWGKQQWQSVLKNAALLKDNVNGLKKAYKLCQPVVFFAIKTLFSILATLSAYSTSTRTTAKR